MERKYNIIGKDEIGDWLLYTTNGTENVTECVERAKRAHTQYKRIYAVKCSA